MNLTINSSNTGTDTQTACDSYTWIDGNTYTSSNSTATHTLTNAARCDSVVTLDLTINTVDNGITNSSPTLTANATSGTYQWLDCDNNYSPIAGETNQSYTATANGSYAVEVTQNNCTDTSTCELVNNVSILENTFIKAPQLFPNPTSGELTLELDNKYDNITINVRTLSGKLVSTQDYKSASNITFEINETAGIYIVEVYSQQGSAAKFRVIIQ